MSDGGRGHIGVIAGVAVHKNAARRNFWKRQSKSVLQELGSSKKDFLLILLPEVNTLTRMKFRKLLQEAGVGAVHSQ